MSTKTPVDPQLALDSTPSAVAGATPPGGIPVPAPALPASGEVGVAPLPLTAIVLTKNEARDLPDCLASVVGLTERLVVLDSGSDDATVAIARRFTPHVYSRPFDGYASQRTAALALAAHPWVLFLDADERLTPASRAEIRQTLGAALERDGGPVGYTIPRRNELFGRYMRGGGWWPDAQLRLFRRDRAHYDPTRQVHEVVQLDGAVDQLREPLIHRNYDSWPEFQARQRGYARYHAGDLLRRGVRPRPWTYLTQPLREFHRRYITLGAWREGWLGLALAAALAYYEGLAHVILRARLRSPRADGDWPPATLLAARRASPPAPRIATISPAAALDLSVIVVSYNTRELLRRCLASVQASLAGSDLTGEIIVVDNASADGSAAMVRAAFPDVTTLACPDNRGFAAGNNQGLAASRGRALLLLNPDTEVTGDAIATLLRALEVDPGLGVVGPALRYPNGTPQPSRRRFPTRLTPFLESTLVQQYWRRNRVLDRYYLADRPDDQPQDADWLHGACLLVRRAAVAQVGGLDESFFMYSEELEWCARLRAVGWRIGYEPAAMVIHHEGASSSQAAAHRQINFNSSKVLYYRRRYGPLFGETLRVFLLLTYLVQIAQEGGKWLVGHRRPLRRQRLGAYLTVLRSGLRARPLPDNAASNRQSQPQ